MGPDVNKPVHRGQCWERAVRNGMPLVFLPKACRELFIAFRPWSPKRLAGSKTAPGY